MAEAFLARYHHMATDPWSISIIMHVPESSPASSPSEVWHSPSAGLIYQVQRPVAQCTGRHLPLHTAEAMTPSAVRAPYRAGLGVMTRSTEQALLIALSREGGAGNMVAHQSAPIHPSTDRAGTIASLTAQVAEFRATRTSRTG